MGQSVMPGIAELAENDGAAFPELFDGGKKVAERVRRLAELWHKPVIFTELGYTTRRDPAVRPWEWPEALKGVDVDQLAQADAYRGLLAEMGRERATAGTLAPAVEHFRTVTQSYWLGLFQCYQVAELPRTNNDLEQKAELVCLGWLERGKILNVLTM